MKEVHWYTADGVRTTLGSVPDNAIVLMDQQSGLKRELREGKSELLEQLEMMTAKLVQAERERDESRIAQRKADRRSSVLAWVSIVLGAIGLVQALILARVS